MDPIQTSTEQLSSSLTGRRHLRRAFPALSDGGGAYAISVSLRFKLNQIFVTGFS
jgi:hypothetical protein